MKTLVEMIKDSFEEFIEDFAREMNERGKVASGKVEESFVIESNDSGLILTNTAMPVSILQNGREPGKGPYDFISILEKWSFDKGIQFDKPEDRRSFAYLLSKRIKEQGIEGDPDKWLDRLLSGFSKKLSLVYYNYVKGMLNFK